MASQVRLLVTIFAGTVIEAPGTFSIAGDRFDGHMEYLFDDTYDTIWDFAGILSTRATTQPGDFDGDVDGRDFLKWQRGGSPAPLSSDDLAAWQTNYGVGSLGVALVPEPNTLAIVVGMTLWRMLIDRKPGLSFCRRRPNAELAAAME